MKEIKLANKLECTGCGACVVVCLKRCIELTYTNSLHSFPTISTDNCISCGRCMSVCPNLNHEKLKKNLPPNSVEQIFYVAWHNDVSIKKYATSGAVACAIYQVALENDYFICGAAFDSNWHLAHIVSNQPSDIDRFKGSKYLQSETLFAFKTIIKLIKEDKKVCFIGTPCQVDAICRLVPFNKRDLLLTCAIICHGVNSPIVWNDFIEGLQKKYKHKIIQYNFRSKAYGWGKLAIDYTLENGKNIVKPARKNLFHYWFGKHYLLRPACIKCSYRGTQRYADITIGDFWGIEKIMPSLETKDGVSVLITSTTKGREFISKCNNMTMLETNPDVTSQVLKGFLQKKSNDVLNNEIGQASIFETEYLHNSYSMMAKKYPIPSLFSRMIQIIVKR